MTTPHDADDEFIQLGEIMRDGEVDVAALRPRTRRARRRAAIVTAIVLAVILAATGGYVAWALTAPVKPPVAAVQTPTVSAPPAAAASLPRDGAAAVSIAGGEEFLGASANGIWAAGGGDDERPIASITKLITAMVVLDAHPLSGVDDAGPVLSFDKADRDLYDKYYVMGATIAPMPAGSSLAERDALAMMLVPSAANYAEAIARWAFGSTGAFADAARRWLDAHELHGTTIVEPTGNDPRNTSTPGDLIAIAKLASAEPVIAAIAAKPSVQGLDGKPLYNTNRLVGTHGVTGLKTGNLGAGAYDSLFTASVAVASGPTLTVTGVILGGATRDTVDKDVVALLDSIQAGFHTVPLVKADTEIGTYTTAWGASARLVVGESASVLTWSDTPITAAMDLRSPTDYTDGEVVGSITWTAGPRTATAPLRVKGSIPPPTEWWRLTHPGDLGGQ